jgi:hypothetical protein
VPAIRQGTGTHRPFGRGSGATRAGRDVVAPDARMTPRLYTPA